MPSFYIVTLGCKVNQYETQSLREAWLRQGLSEVETPGAADVLIVNSCAITAKAVADVRAAVRKLHREQPLAPVIVTGCAAEVMGEELSAIKGVSRVFPRKEKALLLEGNSLIPDLSAALTEGSAQPLVAPVTSISPTGEHTHPLMGKALTNSNSTFPPFQITGYDRSRAVLKIQDGCSHCCTYCIVPRARGGSVSRPVGETLDEAERLLKAGFSEIVISGVNLRQFRLESRPARENPTEDFWLFIEALEKRFASGWAERARFRISSLEPGQLTQRAVDILGASRLVAPHLHLSLQSGSDTVLARMGRGHYSVEDIRSGLEKLGAVWQTFGLGADIISGFPGETAEEHTQTANLLTELPLTYAHVFPYSRRPHTLAARMAQQIDGPLKKQRAAELRAIAATKQQQFTESMLKIPHMQVAVEQAPNKWGKAHGVNQWYVECEFIDEVTAILTPERKQRHAAVLINATPVAVKGERLLVRAF